jgi:putative spermidine/putrescine transport system permease protein
MSADHSRADPSPVPARRQLPLVWIGLLPFTIFALLFLILPTMRIVLGAFQTPEGGFTLENLWGLNTPSIRSAYWVSVKISAASSLFGCLIGFAIAAAVVLGGLPKAIRGPILTFSGVASNFAGVPLAFAFIATLGPLGLITVFLNSHLGINLRAYGFNILSFWGLTLVYLFFQIPLMILIITPALDGLKREWREAAQVLGATGPQYWRMVALPILFPSLLGTFALLFANAFGAVATAIALTGSSLNIVPILLFAQIRGDVLGNPHLGYALAFGMIVITGIANGVYIWLRARSERWLK